MVRLRLPPLRERREDIPLLASRFLAAAAGRLHAPAKRLSPAALERLQAHAWPGNVRELENLCWRLAALAPGASLGVHDLDEAAGPLASSVVEGEGWEAALAEWARTQLHDGTPDLHAQARARLDRVLLQAALEHSDGHRGAAAEKLGVGRNTLTRKLGPGRKRR